MKAIKWLDRNSEKAILVILLITILTVNVVQIIMRFFFKNSLPWAEELSRYMLIWSGFIGVSYTLRYNTAMRLTLLFSVLPKKGRNVISLVSYGIMGVFFCWMAVNSVELLKITNQKSATLGFPIAYVYSCAVICGILSAARCLQGIVRIVKTFQTKDASLWDPNAEIEKESGGIG